MISISAISIDMQNKFAAPDCLCPIIAEGSGSQHPKEFAQFLNIARRSLFEDASMLMVFEKMEIIGSSKVDELLADCDVLSRKITNFIRTL